MGVGRSGRYSKCSKTSKKGQATVEYLVLLAVAIVIGLVVFGFMGWIPGVAGSLRERQSKMYWASTWPLTVKEYKGANSSSGLTLLLENVADSKIIVTEIAAGGNETTITGNYQLKPGEKRQYDATNTKCGPVGTTFEFDNVSVTYDVVGGISGNAMMGDRPLIGRCVSG